MDFTFFKKGFEMKISLLIALGFIPMAVSTASPATIRQVLTVMHASHKKELQLGQLALDKGTTLQTRGLGESLIKDSQKADDALVQVVQHTGLEIPPEPVSAEWVQLKPLSGPAFDRAFAQAVIRMHEQDLQKLRPAAEDLPSIEVRRLVENYLPTIEKHLEWAENIRS
jgi:putative membrane protein